ncbi:MAG: Carbohydrate kinase, FGGY-like protein [Polyangiaceae bacterium]|jgi:xylulokinase|nr:Carbohydrate kinase, FGGY-like protein [Polyangiaceae bacterium]
MVIDTTEGRVLLDQSVNFGKALPEYASPSGFLAHEDPQIKHANPLMWVAALDLLLGNLKAAGTDFSKIEGISGAGQQHGSVYLAKRLDEVPAWDASQDLVSQVRPLLSRATSPIWMDSSTSAQCRAIADAVGGDARVVSISGSRAVERFTGPQIRAFYERDPQGYAETREVHLVSSFLASVLVGKTAPIDHGDGAGMNLLELASGTWSPELLTATAPGLAERLPPAVPSRTIVGELSGYFVRKYGFKAGTPVVAFTGDNPSSLVGMGATEPGTAVVSMGTSDTVFAAMRQPLTDPRGFGHVFGNPGGGFMCLICFANGSLAREKVAERTGLTWEAFERAILQETEPGNQGNWLLPFFIPEMTPKVLSPKVELFGNPQFTAWEQPAALARAIVEAQALSMQRHSDWIGEQPKVIRVTGGASRNRGIRQVLADVFGAEIRSLSVGNSSALGAALRAAEAVGSVPFPRLYEAFAATDDASSVTPRIGATEVYGDLRQKLVERLAALGA